MLLVARGQRVKRDLGQNILPARFAPRSAKWRECEGETRKTLTAINKMGKMGKREMATATATGMVKGNCAHSMWRKHIKICRPSSAAIKLITLADSRER